jgi:putative acetyltransferase
MIQIRPEKPDDRDGISEVTRQAFGCEEEVGLIIDIRNSEYFIPELSLVAVEGNTIVGHVLFSKIKLETGTEEKQVLTLAPMAVSPEFQKQGVGIQLVKAGLEEAARLGYTIVAVIGHPGYYPRFGFTPARACGIDVRFEVPDEAFMVLGLVDGALDDVEGIIKFSPPFEKLM